MPERIQLALQGGGAKLVALIAAMKAIEKLEETGAIEVTRISGTSAGSIVATLFAAGVPMGEVQTYLEGVREKDLLGGRWKRWIGLPIARMATGSAANPVHGLLSDRLKELLAKGSIHRALRRNPVEIGELRIPTFVLVSNLQDKCSETRTGAHHILSAVQDSCALPLLLKGYSDSNNAAYVDGGLVANLPSDMLHEGRPKYGPVFGISFAPESSGDTGSRRKYLAALISTAIAASVARAKEQLGEANVFEISTDLDTFDFSGAIGSNLKGRAAELNGIEQAASQFFQGAAATIAAARDAANKQAQELMGNPWMAAQSNEFSARQVAMAMEDVYALHLASCKTNRIRIAEHHVHVVARSLERIHTAGEEIADDVQSSSTFELIEGRLSSHAAGLGLRAGNFLGSHLFVSLNRGNGFEVTGARVLPAINPAEPKARFAVVALDDPMEVGHSIRIQFSDQFFGMVGALIADADAAAAAKTQRNGYREDELFFKNHRAADDPARVVRITMAIPPHVDVEMHADPNTPAANRGRAMTAKEMAAEIALCTPGYKCQGWIWDGGCATHVARVMLRTFVKSANGH